MAKLAASAYGQALFELAVESGKAAEYMEQVKNVIKALEESPELFDLLNHPKVSKKEKTKAVEDIFGPMLAKDITGMLVLAVNKDRQNEIPAILKYFVDKTEEYLKIGNVKVITPMELDDGQKAKVESKLKSTTSYTTLNIDYEIDKSLIGGMIIRIGDRIVDTSIKSKLAKLSKELTETQLG